MMYFWQSCKILLLLLVIVLMFQQSQKESFINFKDLKIYKDSRINYNKCRRKLRIGFKNQYNIMKTKAKNNLKNYNVI